MRQVLIYERNRSMSEKIKPCPCCGSNDVHAYGDNTIPAYPVDYEIVCHKCGMRCSKSGKDKAIKTWNRRVDLSEPNVNKGGYQPELPVNELEKFKKILPPPKDAKPRSSILSEKKAIRKTELAEYLDERLKDINENRKVFAERQFENRYRLLVLESREVEIVRIAAKFGLVSRLHYPESQE